MIAATFMSGAFLFSNVKGIIFDTAPAKASLVLALMMGSHLALGLALKLVFFQYFD